jgi:hypothetical protein
MGQANRLDAEFNKPLFHLSGCDVLDAPPENEGLDGEITVNRDELIAYALAVRPQYNKLGRLIGQLAGLLLLAQAHGRFDVDYEAFKPPLEQAQECTDAIRSITPPNGAKRRHWTLCRAMAVVNGVTDQFTHSIGGETQVREQVGKWSDQLKRANAMVRWASDSSLGMNPVDFSQACCCCNS